MFRPEILKCHGIDWDSVPEKTAIKLADEFISQNREVHPWIEAKHPDKISAVAPGVGSLFYYVHQDGLVDDASVAITQDMQMEGNLGKGKQGFNLEILPAGILGLENKSAASDSSDKGDPNIKEHKQFGLVQGRVASVKTA
jgi:hypothetical protein